MSIMLSLLQLVLLASPITSAYATQVRYTVAVSVTYATHRPTQVCVLKHALTDTTMAAALDAHCWTPANDIGDIDNWPSTDLMAFNFEVVVKYAIEPTVTIYLIQIMNS